MNCDVRVAVHVVGILNSLKSGRERQRRREITPVVLHLAS